MAIPIEVLNKVTVVYTHKNCPDGIASAMILKDAFRMLGTNPRIEFLAHNTPEHRRAGVELNGGDRGGHAHENALFCDIAPHPEAANLLNKLTGGPTYEGFTVVLDHHKGAEELVRSFGELGVFADEKLEPGVSGAVLAFREVWLPANAEADKERDPGEYDQRKPVEAFAMNVGVRDTWQTEDHRFAYGQWISKMLMSKPASYWLGRPRTSPFLLDMEIEAGRALFDAHEEAVRQAVAQCVHFDVGSARLIVFQEQASGFRLCSDVAESLRQKWRGGDPWAVVAGFSYVVDKPGDPPKLLYSLRGLNSFDVAAFAKANGGGGHTAAAGFSVELDSVQVTDEVVATSPYEFIRQRLEEFLRAR